jgi:uncharacterized protein YdhG (YjbR/CyaY superfamily)
MPDNRNATKNATKAAAGDRWTDDEVAAMKERSRELKAAKGGAKVDGESDLLAKIADMPESDRTMAERIHAIVKATAPELQPKTWYGMPAWARDGKVVCFFKAADKFKSRFATFGFEEAATLDDGSMWPTSWALTALTADGEAKIAELVKKAVR